MRQRITPPGARGFVDLKLGHFEVIDVGGKIDIYTAPRLRELLTALVSTDNYQLIVNLERVEFLDSTGLGVLVGGLKRAASGPCLYGPECLLPGECIA